MNKAELLNDLKAKDDIVAVLYESDVLSGSTSVQNETSKVVLIVEKVDNLTVYNVPILVQHHSDPDLWNKGVQPISVLNDGATDGSEEARYHGKKNFDDSRDQLYTDQQYINGIESNFPDYNVLRINVRKVGDTDEVQVTASDGVSGEVISKTIVVWNNDQGNPEFKIKQGG